MSYAVFEYLTCLVVVLGFAILVFLVFLILAATGEGIRYVIEAKPVLLARRRGSFQSTKQAAESPANS
jgi:hypothetical protein